MFRGSRGDFMCEEMLMHIGYCFVFYKLADCYVIS